MIKTSKRSKAQIIATIGPASSDKEKIFEMIAKGMDAARLNFSWGDLSDHKKQIAIIKEVSKELGRNIPIIQDLPGPRIQKKHGHTYDNDTTSAITERDKDFIKFGVENDVDYIAVSFVGDASDIKKCREYISLARGKQPIIAKIERKKAVHNLREIVEAADAVMIARGDLGSEIPLEQIPFVQGRIIAVAKQFNKPVITATQMLLSMTYSPEPTRAEVTDVETAIIEGSDAVMLSEETASGKYPVQAVAMMEKIVLEAEKYRTSRVHTHLL